MKVLLVNTYPTRVHWGVEVVVENLMAGLRRKGHKADLLCLSDVELAIQLQNRATIVSNQQDIACAQYAQVLARHIKLQDFSEVHETELGIPEQAIQGIPGLDLELQFFDRIRRRKCRFDDGRGRPGRSHRGCAEGLGDLRGELVSGNQRHRGCSDGYQGGPERVAGAHQGAAVRVSVQPDRGRLHL